MHSAVISLGLRLVETNVNLEKGTLIFIKDESDTEWSDAAAEKDVRNVLRANPRGTK